MPITIGGYEFAGPFAYTSSLEDKSGVYAILCVKSDGSSSVLDVGESATVKSRVENHERADCWKKNCSFTIKYAVHYTPNLQQQGRMEIEQAIRKKYKVPCGKA